MKGALLKLSVTMYWNEDSEKKLTRTCCVGEYKEGTCDDDIFYWFGHDEEILGEHGDFTVTAYKVIDAFDNIYLTKLEEYADYMETKCQSEGYNVPVSIKQFLDLQVFPLAIAFLNFKKPRDLAVFLRVKELYLNHAHEMINATEMSNTPVLFGEWLMHEAEVSEDE